MSKKQKMKSKLWSILITILLLIIISIIEGNTTVIEAYLGLNFENTEAKIVTAEETENIILEENNLLNIYYFDVGQADSILLVHNNESMLIDAGNNDDGDLVVNNLRKLGIKKLDYVVGTHPHEDHIGGLDDVINNFEIGNVFMPKVQTNTKTFEDVLDSIDNKGLKVEAPKVGKKVNIGDTTCEIMLCGDGSQDEQENLNLSSIVIRATFKDQSYLFMADSETENEESRSWPQTNVIKIGHHGSSTSSSKKFLNQVMPQIAVIQVGVDNSYFHPHNSVIERLEKMGTLIYRTDEKRKYIITKRWKKQQNILYRIVKLHKM